MPILPKFMAPLERTIPYTYRPPSPGVGDDAAAGASLIFTCRSSFKRELPFRDRSSLAGIRFPRSNSSLDRPGFSKRHPQSLNLQLRSSSDFITDSRRNRKHEIDYGSFAYGTSHANPAGVILDDSFHDPQAKARSLSALGGHKGLKHGFLNFRADAAAGVGNGKADPVAQSVGGTDCSCANNQPAAGGHTVARIDDQIR